MLIRTVADELLGIAHFSPAIGRPSGAIDHVRPGIPRIVLQPLTNAGIQRPRFANRDAIPLHKHHHHGLREQFFERGFRSESHVVLLQAPRSSARREMRIHRDTIEIRKLGRAVRFTLATPAWRSGFAHNIELDRDAVQAAARAFQEGPNLKTGLKESCSVVDVHAQHTSGSGDTWHNSVTDDTGYRKPGERQLLFLRNSLKGLFCSDSVGDLEDLGKMACSPAKTLTSFVVAKMFTPTAISCAIPTCMDF